MTQGYLRKRGDSWYVYWRDLKGGQHSKSFGKDHNAATSFLHKKRKQLEEDAANQTTDISIQQFANLWLNNYSKANLKPSTTKNQISIIRCHILPYFGNVNLRYITTKKVQEFVKSELDLGQAPSTVTKTLTLLKSMLRSAVEWGYLEYSVAALVKSPPKRFHEMSFLTPDEICALLNATPEDWRPFIHTEIFTGMRFGEITALQWPDIDWDKNVIHVNRSVWRGKFQEPKTRNGVRTIGMSPSLKDVLSNYRMWCTPSDMGLVFCSQRGHPIDESNFRKRVFGPTLDRAGIKHIRFHDLRHTFASLLINQGENLKYVQQQMGHSSIVTTVDHYGHLMPNSHEDTYRALDGTVFEGSAYSYA